MHRDSPPVMGKAQRTPLFGRKRLGRGGLAEGSLAYGTVQAAKPRDRPGYSISSAKGA